MSRFKNEVAHLQAHVKTLRLGAGALFVVALLLGFGWWSAPKSLTIHVPPDLRSGSTRKWWDVPPESVYAFSFYIWQQVQRWPTNGEEDYPRNLRALSAYLTPSCYARVSTSPTTITTRVRRQSILVDSRNDSASAQRCLAVRWPGRRSPPVNWDSSSPRPAASASCR